MRWSSESDVLSCDMAQSLSGLSDVELQNVFDTTGSRKRQHANKRASVAEEILEDSGDHSTDPFDGKEKEIDLVSRQNVEVEDENSVNTDGEVVNSEFAHIVEGIPTDKKEDKADDETGDTRPMEKLICDDTESGIMVNDNKEADPSLNNEEYGGYKRAVLTSFEHMESEDHSGGNEDSGSNEEHQLVNVEVWYSLSRSCILWMHIQFEVKSHWLTGQHKITIRLWTLTIGIEYPWGFFKYMIVLDVSTCSTSSRGTTHEMNPDVSCELMPNFRQRESKHHSFQEAVTQNCETLDVSAVSKSQRREVAQGGKECMTSVIELAIDGKMDIWKYYLYIFQNHLCFQIPDFTVCAIPLPPRYFHQIYIPLQESSNQPIPAAVYPAARQVGVVPDSATADPASDEDGCINDHMTHGSGADAYAARLVGYMTDPQILAQNTFEIAGLRLGGCSPISVIVQETDQQATGRYDLRISQNESPRALYTRGTDHLPAPAFPAIISSRSSEGPSQTTGSKFAPRQSPSVTGSPSADLCRQGDASQTTDICPNRLTDHHSSACLQKSNDTKKEVAPSETGSPSIDDCRSLWDAPGTPGVFLIRETDHYTQKEAAALKESKAVDPTKNQQKVSANTGTKKEPSPVYPDYTERTTRIASFREWSRELQQPEEMADCGFYHTGYQDIVRCFACDGHFKNWVPDRNPWMEHARWFPKCPYILQIKGVKFVNSVRRMAEESDEKDYYTIHHGAPLGGAESSNRDDSSDPHNNCTAVIDVAGSKAPIYGAVGGAAASTPGIWEIKKYLLTDAAQSVLGMGYQLNLVPLAIKRVLMKIGTQMTEQVIIQALFEIEEETRSPTEPPSQTGQGNEITGNGDEGGDGDLCKLCKMDPICKIFLPCYHSVACSECAITVKKCPVCRTLITGLTSAISGVIGNF